jgi:hypothetical protein
LCFAYPVLIWTSKNITENKEKMRYKIYSRKYYILQVELHSHVWELLPPEILPLFATTGDYKYQARSASCSKSVPAMQEGPGWERAAETRDYCVFKSEPIAREGARPWRILREETTLKKAKEHHRLRSSSPTARHKRPQAQKRKRVNPKSHDKCLAIPSLIEPRRHLA